MRARRLEVAPGLEVGQDRRASLVPVKACVGGAQFVDPRLVVEDRDHGQAVALAGLEVIEVVGRCDLDGAGAERSLDDIVSDDRHVALDEGDPHGAPDERLVALVRGVDRDGRVAEDRLGPRGRDADPGRRIGVAGGVQEVVADSPQRARLGCGDRLEVGDAGAATGAPVDEGFGSMGQAVVIQALEGGADGPCRTLVHGVALAAPVEGSADAFMLALHDVAGLVDELAHPFQVSLSTQGLSRLSLGGEDPVEHELGRDRGMILARQPERRTSRHARVAGHGVLDRRPLSMPKVEGAGDVGWRLDDHEGRLRPVRPTARPVGGEDVGGEPARVDARLDAGRVVGLGQSPRLLVAHRSPPVNVGPAWGPRIERPARPADERGRGTTCWFGRGAGRSSRSEFGPRPSRRAIGRHPSRLASDLHASLAPRACSPSTRGLCRPSGALLLSVPAVRRRV